MSGQEQFYVQPNTPLGDELAEEGTCEEPTVILSADVLRKLLADSRQASPKLKAVAESGPPRKASRPTLELKFEFLEPGLVCEGSHK